MPYVERINPASDSAIAMAKTAEHLSRYLFALGFVTAKHVADVGTGYGYGAVLLSGRAASVQASDIDEQAINDARRQWRDAAVRFFVDDAEALAHTQRPVDVVVSFENIEHLREPRRFVSAAARILEPEGLLICSTPDRLATENHTDGRPANPYHVNEWYEQEFRELLGAGFRDITVLTQVRLHATDLRAHAARSVQEHLQYLWASPVLRLQRVIRRSLGKRTPWPDVTGLAAATPWDFPVVAVQGAPLLGTPIAHVALCRNAVARPPA